MTFGEFSKAMNVRDARAVGYIAAVRSGEGYLFFCHDPNIKPVGFLSYSKDDAEIFESERFSTWHGERVVWRAVEYTIIRSVKVGD